MKIGDWVRREASRTNSACKWHLVESVVADDAVTRCGRRMDRVTASGGELELSEVMPLTRMIGQPQNCRQCDRPLSNETGKPLNSDSGNGGAVGLPEDDGSTAPTDDTP